MLSPPSMTPPPNPQVNALICWTLSMKITMLGYIVIEDCIVWMRNKRRQLTSGGQRQKAKLSVDAKLRAFFGSCYAIRHEDPEASGQWRPRSFGFDANMSTAQLEFYGQAQWTRPCVEHASGRRADGPRTGQ